MFIITHVRDSFSEYPPLPEQVIEEQFLRDRSRTRPDSLPT